MTLFAFRGVKGHEWTFYGTIMVESPVELKHLIALRDLAASG